ncbi:unknown protein [Microcystis aeruginosa NIES-843]|uniref:Uncharacterized protein n=1 Tax=Microcystis aeruginosa (strain NIES-843 / IAM M-2473) TaxID=449447 RepID=B0JJF7_MICAN|nr:unknown protein [Microcystis aeruginosa NIES-843]
MANNKLTSCCINKVFCSQFVIISVNHFNFDGVHLISRSNVHINHTPLIETCSHFLIHFEQIPFKLCPIHLKRAKGKLSIRPNMIIIINGVSFICIFCPMKIKSIFRGMIFDHIFV